MRRIPRSTGRRPRCVRCGAFLSVSNATELCYPCRGVDRDLTGAEILLLRGRIRANHGAQARRERWTRTHAEVTA